MRPQLLTFSALVLCSWLLATRAAIAEEQAKRSEQVAQNTHWENISAEFFRKIEVEDVAPIHMRRCSGMAVTPTGEIFIVAGSGKGVCVSKDQGATWSVVAGSDAVGSRPVGNGITGRCETGFSFSMAYPYDGRLAFFCIDGSGGITLDGGVTWRPFGKLLRMLEYADVDWSTRDPQTIFGLLHEPYFTVLSRDGGRSWLQIYKDSENPNDNRKAIGQFYGLVNSETLLRSHVDQGGISLSTDEGKSWSDVAKFHIIGRRPVHYGKKTYWTATEGVVATENGKHWTLTGPGPEKAVFGPYFGRSDQEMMVVSDKAFFVTRDGGKTWKEVAPAFNPPDGMRKQLSVNGAFNYFGWDATHDLIYASSLGASIYRLKLQP